MEVVGLEVFEIVGVFGPAVNDHNPVPMEGEFAANAVEVPTPD